ncbi:MAG: PKD domain-containing protein [Bacteroidota bacterium]|nr:PKD domain-containing protein [Bacteroidota bacterium]
MRYPGYENITINPRPAPVISGPGAACQNSGSHLYSTTAVPGSSYAWSVSGGTITAGQGTNSITVSWGANGTGSLTVKETNSLGCDTTVAYSVTKHPRPIPSLVGDTIVCRNTEGHVYQTVSHPGNTYTWAVDGGVITSGQNTNSINVTWLHNGGGIVTLTETNLAGCDTTVSTSTVTINPRPVPVITGEEIVCRNNPGYLYTTPLIAGHKYDWIIAGGTIDSGQGSNQVRVNWTSLLNGLLWVKETNEFGCDTTVLTNIQIIAQPSANVQGQASVCAFKGNNSYSVPANPDAIYEWQIVGGDVTGDSTGSSVIVQWGMPGQAMVIAKVTHKITGCYTLDTFHVTLKDAPTPLISGEAFNCSGIFRGKYATKYKSGNSYTWQAVGGVVLQGNGTNVVDVQWNLVDGGFGEIIVTETTPNGCDSTVRFAVRSQRLDNSILYDNPGCAPSSVSFRSTQVLAVSNFHWDFGDGHVIAGMRNNVTHNYFNPGTYTVTLIITNDSGCTDTSYAYIEMYGRPKAEFKVNYIAGKETFLMQEDTVSLTNQSVSGYSYIWDFGDGHIDTAQHPFHVYDSIGTYFIKLVTINEFGCKDSVTKRIRVTAPVEIFVPNAFTPDGDGVNDHFRVVTLNVTEFEVLIFNRWGEILYRSNDSNFEWDAIYKGVYVEEEVYLYIIRAKGIEGQAITKEGTITVLR